MPRETQATFDKSPETEEWTKLLPEYGVPLLRSLRSSSGIWYPGKRIRVARPLNPVKLVRCVSGYFELVESASSTLALLSSAARHSCIRIEAS